MNMEQLNKRLQDVEQKVIEHGGIIKEQDKRVMAIEVNKLLFDDMVTTTHDLEEQLAINNLRNAEIIAKLDEQTKHMQVQDQMVKEANAEVKQTLRDANAYTKEILGDKNRYSLDKDSVTTARLKMIAYVLIALLGGAAGQVVIQAITSL